MLYALHIPIRKRKIGNMCSAQSLWADGVKGHIDPYYRAMECSTAILSVHNICSTRYTSRSLLNSVFKLHPIAGYVVWRVEPSG